MPQNALTNSQGPDKRTNRKLEVLVRDLSGLPTYQELADAEPSFRSDYDSAAFFHRGGLLNSQLIHNQVGPKGRP
jgi:hypothetical protein